VRIFLSAMLRRRERGVLDTAQRVVIDSVWVEERTVRQVGPPVPWFMDQ
jgi:hypothetical protein